MLEILQAIYVNMPAIVPAFLTVAVIWILAGWFYVHIWGKELHDFVVLSVLAFIILMSVVIIGNRDVQMLFFGNY